MKQDKILVNYDFTSFDDTETTKDELIELFKKHCKKWGFQQEICPNTGTKHYQGRFKLGKKCRINNIPFAIGHYSVTTSESAKAANFYTYVTKDFSRIAGPWQDSDEVLYIPRQFKGVLDTLRPFQQNIWDSRKDFNDRVIKLIYDPKGNKGKSTISSLIDLHTDGFEIPAMNDADRIIASVCNICVSKNIRSPNPLICDIPRAMKQEKLFGLFQALEQIKKGKLYDTRNSYKEWWIDSPIIWVFMNVFSTDIYNLLSKDRFEFYKVTSNGFLIRFNPITDTETDADELYKRSSPYKFRKMFGS